MAVVLVVHHGQHPAIRARALRSCFPLAPHKSPRSVLPHAGLVGQFPMVDVLPAPVATYVGDATLVVVAGRYTRIAMVSGVVLACAHEGGEVGIFAFGGWGHAIVGVCVVGREGGGAGLVVVFLQVVHGGRAPSGASSRASTSQT